MTTEHNAASNPATLARFVAILAPHADVQEVSGGRLRVSDAQDTWTCDASEITADILDTYEASRAAVDALSDDERADDDAYYAACERSNDAWTNLCQSVVSE